MNEDWVNDWYLAARLPPDEPEGARAVEVEGRPILLVPLAGGWAALEGRCGGCGATLGLEAIRAESVVCARCGRCTGLGPEDAGPGRLPAMTVDQEIYIWLEE